MKSTGNNNVRVSGLNFTAAVATLVLTAAAARGLDEQPPQPPVEAQYFQAAISALPVVRADASEELSSQKNEQLKQLASGIVAAHAVSAASEDIWYVAAVASAIAKAR